MNVRKFISKTALYYLILVYDRLVCTNFV